MRNQPWDAHAVKYDAIIVGASFAGLAVASRLRGKILLIDKKDIGQQQTSACGTLLKVPQSLEAMDSVLQIYDSGFIHTPSRTIQYPLHHRFCSLDYGKFCQIISQRTEVKFLKARVKGMVDSSVVTDNGLFQGNCLIDASGWKAVLASSLDKDFVTRSEMSFGIETEVIYQDKGLHFWVDPRLIKRGFAWLFPCGTYSRFGIGSYLGKTDLKSKLTFFMEQFHLQPEKTHGGFFPWRLRKPTVGNVLVVGDAAGQCLPLTGEGIRPALYFGSLCGHIVQRVIDQEISLEEGLGQYERIVKPCQSYYSISEWLQRNLLRLPPFWLTRLLSFFSHKPVWRFLLNTYDSPAPSRKHPLFLYPALAKKEIKA